MSVSEPSKILTPWATSGLKNTIPSAADPVTGKAGYDQGFPAINMTAKEAGGIPPFGQDFNGIFFDVTQILQYMQAGGHPTYSSTLSTAIGGYPLGAMLAKASGLGFWRNITVNNTTNPDSGGAGWISDSPGSYANAIIVTAASTSLASAQMGQAFLFTTAAGSVALPAASSVAAGGAYKLHTSAGFTLSVTGGGSMQVGNASVTSLSVPAGTEVLAVSAGASWWVFGTGALVNSASFLSLSGPPGYQKLPSGKILQWGTVTFNTADSVNGTLNTFPIAFPNSCYLVIATDFGSASAACASFATGGYTAANFRAWARNPASSGAFVTASGRYLAIGE